MVVGSTCSIDQEPLSLREGLTPVPRWGSVFLHAFPFLVASRFLRAFLTFGAFHG